METLVTAGLVAVTCAADAVAALRVRRVGSMWQLRRIVAFMGGVILLGSALLPALATHDQDFTVHVVQHLLLSMFAPFALAMGAPVTLLLRVLPARGGRVIVRILRHAVVRVLAHPVTAALLSIGGLWLLYWTPLYGALAEHAGLHAVVHLHFLLAGCLFTWSLVGIDPMPHRASFGSRVAVLVGGSAAHAVIAKLLYAYGPVQWHTGAELMWYGGDVIDVLLLLTLFRQWYVREGRLLEHARRFVRGTATGSASDEAM